ncbi:MAG: HypC/HybG/HupF family hydrogenase formation chaperone [bacterium]
MCIAFPGKISSIEDNMARVEIEGTEKEVCLDLIGEVSVGDYVISHAGFAIHLIDKEEAEERLKILREIVKSDNEVY